MSEIEFKILSEYRSFKKFQSDIDIAHHWEDQLNIWQGKIKGSTIKEEIEHLKSEIFKKKIALENKKKEIGDVRNIYDPNHFGISKDEFLFFKQRLFSRGLLKDNGVGAIGRKQFDIMGITEFGIGFIDYIVADVESY